MCSRLARLQDALQLHVLVTLKANAEVQALLQEDRYQKSLAQHQDIVRLLSESELLAYDMSSQQTQTLLHQHNKSDRMSRRHFARTMAAIQQLPARIKFKQTLAALEHLRVTDPAHLSRVAHIEQAEVQHTPQEMTQARASVLDNLRFRQMKLREHEVSNAHHSTFKWIFDNEHSESWDDFAHWLRNGTGCYWINGKAASGKSTLMKYIVGNSRTATALRQWAGDSYLLTLSFFFWHSGTFLQRSQEGLYRSILFEVLSKHDSQIPDVFPELYAEEIRQPCRQTLIQPLSKIELKIAFMKLLEVLPATGRVCLFIDGIDEYDGDHEEICDLFKSIVSQPNVKVVLSSRPIPACVEAFKHCKGLRLEDLTRKDIEEYVSQTLGSQARMQELRQHNPQGAQDLVDHIVSKASGVFLWVILVVRSLISGLKNYDRISDLQRRLDDLPQELEDLYKHMLSNTKPLYRCQASQLLQIALWYFMREREEPLTLLQLSFAEDEDPTTSIRLSDKGLTASELRCRISGTHGRLLSRCCGLLEVSGIVTHDAPVNFLHKSVADFLRVPNVQAFLIQLTDASKFDVNIALMSSTLALLKISRKDWQWQETVILANDKAILPLMRQVQRFFNYCKLAEISSGQANAIYIEECDRIMARGWSHVGNVEEVKPRLENHKHWAVVMSVAIPGEQYRYIDSLVPLAVTHGLGKFIRDSSIVIRTDISPDLLLQTVGNMSRRKNLFHAEDSCEVVESLVLHGANVNHKGGSTRSAWEMAVLHFDQAIEVRDDDLFPDWQLLSCRMLLYLLSHGGDPHARIKRRIYCPYSGQLLVDERSTLCIVEEALRVFSSCRGAGIQQLVAAVTVLLDQLCGAGAESLAWLDGRSIQQSPPTGRVFADKGIFVPYSESSFLTPTRLQTNRRAVEPGKYTYSEQSNLLGNQQLRVSIDTPDEPHGRSVSSEDLEITVPRSHGGHCFGRLSYSRNSNTVSSQLSALGANFSGSPIPFAVRDNIYPGERLCIHYRLARECPLSCRNRFNPPPDGF